MIAPIVLSVIFFYWLAAASAQPVEILPPNFGRASQPQLTTDHQNRFLMAFGTEGKIHFTSSTDASTSWTQPVVIAQLKNLPLGMRRGPRIAQSGKTTVVTAGHAKDLWSWMSDDEGATWKSPVKINDALESAKEALQNIAGGPNGSYFAVWLDDRVAGSMRIYGARSKDGGASWKENVKIYQSPDRHVCECCHPSVVYGKDGKIVVMWRNWLGGARDMYIATSVDGGKTFTPATKLGGGTWPLNACPMDGGGVALSEDGNHQTVWQRKGEVFFSGVDGAEKLLGSGRQPVIAEYDSTTLVAWQNDGILVAESSSKTAPQKVSDKGGFPTIAALPNGDALVAWEEAGNDGTTITGYSFGAKRGKR